MPEKTASEKTAKETAEKGSAPGGVALTTDLQLGSVQEAVSEIISADEALKTASAIAGWQLPNGMIPWFPGGHADPWNHIECAMALDIMGFRAEAERAYGWLAGIQHEDGSWFQYYLTDGVERDRLDTNCIAYIATGVWHHFLCTGDTAFLEEYWPVASKAMDFVLDLQRPSGEIIWARHSDGTPWSFALLTGSCSVYHSLGSAIKIAETLRKEKPDWQKSARSLKKAIAHKPNAFTPKQRWAMDWYYPVLSGALEGEKACEHLKAMHEVFIMKNRGVRCVSDRPWVTAAETSECTLAYLRTGQHEVALNLFALTRQLRAEDGHYFTGLVYPEKVNFPAGEKTTYTSAAVLLAADAFTKASPAASIFISG